MVRKLKVFQAQLGFYDTVVAAPSQAAALRAWESHRNLFAEGVAKPATDEQAIAAALDQPEVALRRAVGTDDPFSLKPGKPHLPKGEPTAPQRQQASRKAAPPDRSALDAAVAALQSIDAAWEKEEAAFRELYNKLSAEERSLKDRRARLDADQEKAAARQRRRRSTAETEVARQRTAFDKAGGRRR